MADAQRIFQSDDVDEIIHYFGSRFELPKAHCNYLRKDIEDAVDQGNPDSKLEMLKSLEQQCHDMQYVLDLAVGSGAFGHVFRGHNRKTGQVVAIKIIDLEETKDDIITISREIMALTQGKTCKQLTEYYASSVFGTKLWIVMEYVDGGSVLDLVKKKPLEEKYISVIVREVLLGLQYLYNDKKFHRDIKCANILLSKSGCVKLADFGATGQLTDTMTKCQTFVGSPYWMAPEVMTQSKYDYKADIWSIGITCIEMTQGLPPNSHVAPLKVISLIPNQPSPRLEGDQWSPAFKNFVSACLIKDPKKRPEIELLLRHPFVKRAPDVSSLRALFPDALHAPLRPQSPAPDHVATHKFMGTTRHNVEFDEMPADENNVNVLYGAAARNHQDELDDEEFQ